MEDEARMRVALKESVQRTYNKPVTLRPKNTQRAYSSRQQEFVDWCKEKGSAFSELTRFTVTGEKLHLFLEENVIGRAKRHKGNSKNVDRKETVGRSTVNSYVAAMVDLWKQQVRAKINCHPSPRDDAVTTLLKLTQYEEDERKRKNFEDRGADTMLDGYTTTEQIQQISSHALMRGESARMMELADLHSIVLENEGYSTCRALVMVMRQRKTNQVGRMEVGACMRNKNVEICPHGMLALYLFWRWHVDGETFPNFKSSESWYPIKLLKADKNPTRAMSYKTHNKAITAALKHVGVQSKAKTHIVRGSGSRMADLGGASESQIRRLGRWNNQSMEKCYLTSLPREVMRTLAGFEPSHGSFFIPRAAVEPSPNLQSLVFPHVEKWQKAIGAGFAELSIAAGGFLELLQYLRTVLLQDAVFLQQVAPKHLIWKHKLFNSKGFLVFKREMMATVSTLEDPAEQRLQKAVPVLNAKIDGVHHDLKAAIDHVGSKMQSIDGKLSDIMHVLAPLTGGTAVLQVKLILGADTTISYTPSSTTPRPSATNSDLTMKLRYKMRKGLESVPDLWNEWTVGVDGNMAVRDLEDQFGTRWCDSDERRFFYRRRPILSLVEDIAASLQNTFAVSVDDSTCLAVESVENCRRTRKKSLNWAAKNASAIADDAKAHAIAQVAIRETASSGI